VQRMVSARPADGEFLPDDEIPRTLWPVLERMAREQVPVLVDTEWKLHEWRRDHPEAREVPRVLGEHRFEIDGVVGRRVVLPHALWRWQRPRDCYQSLPAQARPAASDLARRLGLRVALGARPRMRLARRDNRFIIET